MSSVATEAPQQKLFSIALRKASSRSSSALAALRSSLPMNLRSRRPDFKVWSSAQADIDRISVIWRECIETWGGPFLFGGQYTVADAMYAPVCTRYQTYDVKVDEICTAYCTHILALPDMVEWTRAAAEEQDEVSELEVEF